MHLQLTTAKMPACSDLEQQQGVAHMSAAIPGRMLWASSKIVAVCSGVAALWLLTSAGATPGPISQRRLEANGQVVAPTVVSMVRHGAGQICAGRPPQGWNDLGRVVGGAASEDQCMQLCLARSKCRYAVYNADRGGKCTSFESCADIQESPSFTVFAKRSEVVDFASVLDAMADACEPPPAAPEFEVLGCRGNDGRCKALAEPTEKNSVACRVLQKQGADCFWAKRDPSGECKGAAWDCALGWYATRWQCERKGCTWRVAASAAAAKSASLTADPELDRLAGGLAQLLTSYSPVMHVDASAIAEHLSGNQSDCREQVDEIRSALDGFTEALEAVKSVLDPSEPLLSFQAAGAPEPSDLAMQLQSFEKKWAPTDLGCRGNDGRCSKQGQRACEAANFDCFWAAEDPKGTCVGNDSRCWGAGEQRCVALQASGASCSWALAQEFKEESSALEAEISTLTGSAADMEVLLEGGEPRALALRHALSFVQQKALPTLLAALGMPAAGERL